ncbi:tyrosine-type recombinase/integrase [Acinetobacter pittii]|jgi:integrase|uniref:tyrosine-type recombinase/integrase n=1 Tax=Acinetobacter pittii TaxID=48296 RepID=UPI00070A1FAA|nr:integrase arm-type DNA-binding domain-containing protein [Acinetobacter pittii]KAI0679423.1 integrase arm-type DNA-binding domain-containing protein [Acinetobacter pittii]KQF77063.1 integrase [Acinetobacter pittii]MBA0122255.1 integrase arm-type DNA-binding domain-containing protein [Acinetobacter pittii]MBA0130218.1 integrase arm-type DNA-binding domain-containing protein [Acinetobacter pittii]MBA0134548.1 integrase arm-type DNA-binding domain-containing protein [Acinetobacter pittii]
MLNDLKIKRLKPTEKVFRVADHSGLCLEVRPSGGKFWRFRYRYLTKANMLTIGQYPEVSLAEARLKTLEFRKQLANGVDPSSYQQEELLKAIQANTGTFSLVAAEFLESKAGQQSEEWFTRRKSYYKKDIFPILGNMPIHEVDSIDIKNVLDSTMARIRKSGKGTGEVRGIFVRQIIGEVMTYAIITKRISIDPTYALRGYIKLPEVTHARPLTETEKKELFPKLNAYGGSISTRNAIKAATYSWLRSIEIRRGRKEFISFEDETWTIPAVSRAEILAGKRNMKKNRMHIVPLSKQLIEIIKEQFELYPNSEYIFPGEDGDMIGKTTLNTALDNLDIDFTMHSLRATASTIANENGFNQDWVELQLAHVSDNKTRASYNHAQWLSDRRKMMQWWADHVDSWAD